MYWPKFAHFYYKAQLRFPDKVHAIKKHTQGKIGSDSEKEINGDISNVRNL